MSESAGLIYRTDEDRGYVAEASYIDGDAADALVRILKGATTVREFRFPLYKIYNIAGHFSDIVTSEIEKNTEGYGMAAWPGIPGEVMG